jgi:hypothetical protein
MSITAFLGSLRLGFLLLLLLLLLLLTSDLRLGAILGYTGL